MNKPKNLLETVFDFSINNSRLKIENDYDLRCDSYSIFSVPARLIGYTDKSAIFLLEACPDIHYTVTILSNRTMTIEINFSEDDEISVKNDHEPEFPLFKRDVHVQFNAELKVGNAYKLINMHDKSERICILKEIKDNDEICFVYVCEDGKSDVIVIKKEHGEGYMIKKLS